MGEILLLVETKAGSLDKKTFELIRGASDLGKDLNTDASAVVVGDATASLAESVASFGLKRVYRLEHPLLKGFATIPLPVNRVVHNRISGKSQ